MTDWPSGTGCSWVTACDLQEGVVVKASSSGAPHPTSAVSSLPPACSLLRGSEPVASPAVGTGPGRTPALLGSSATPVCTRSSLLVDCTHPPPWRDRGSWDLDLSPGTSGSHVASGRSGELEERQPQCGCGENLAPAR